LVVVNIKDGRVLLIVHLKIGSLLELLLSNHDLLHLSLILWNECIEWSSLLAGYTLQQFHLFANSKELIGGGDGLDFFLELCSMRSLCETLLIFALGNHEFILCPFNLLDFGTFNFNLESFNGILEFLDRSGSDGDCRQSG
jgi:hypothetical protein